MENVLGWQEFAEEWQEDYFGAKTYINENGFVSYKESEDGKAGFIVNFYVIRSKRKTDASRELIFGFRDFLEAQGFKEFYGEIQLSLTGASSKLRMFLLWGAKIHHCNETCIAVRYDIQE